MAAVGTGNVGPGGEGGRNGQPEIEDAGAAGLETGAPTAGYAYTGDVPGAGAGHVLVLGECLVDLAPVSAAAAGMTDVDAASNPGGTVRTEMAVGEMAVGEMGGGEMAPAPVPAVRYEAEEGTNSGRRQQPRQQLIAMPGGGPANIAVGLARLQVPCAFAGRFSRGGFGPWLRDNLANNAVDLTFSVDADEPATIALVTLDSAGRASYTFYGPTTADWQWRDNELPDLGNQTRGRPAVSAVHTGSIVLTLEPGASTIASWLTRLRQQGQVLISFDPNVRAGLIDDLPAYRDRLTSVVSDSHIVKASTEDVEAVDPGATPEVIAERWLSVGASLVVITEGPDGASAYHHSGARVNVRPPPVKVVDTIGAGDAFTSGLLAYFGDQGLLSPSGIAHLTEAQLHSALAQAVAAGTLTCSRVGADPPNRFELARFVAGQG